MRGPDCARNSSQFRLLLIARSAGSRWLIFRIWRWFDSHRSKLLQQPCGRLRDCLCRFDSLWEGILLTCDLLLIVTATFLLGIYFLPVAVVLTGGVKRFTTLPWHITPKGTLYGPIYGIYMG